LEDDLDRDRSPAGELVFGHDRGDLALARRDRPGEAPQSRGIRWPEKLVDRAADDLLPWPSQEVAGALVRRRDGVIDRIEDDDGFDDGIEDRRRQAVAAPIACTARDAPDPFGRIGRRRGRDRIWHGSSMILAALG